jgi:hypothetical protein
MSDIAPEGDAVSGYTFDDFERWLGTRETAVGTATANGHRPPPAPSRTRVGAGGDVERVVAGCDFVRWCRDHQAAVSEPLWHALLSNLAALDDGRRTAHAFSRAYPGYSESETDAKLDHARRGSLPITCARIRELGFTGCPPEGHGVTSPAALGLPPSTTGAGMSEANVWASAVPVPVFLAQTNEVVDFLEPRLLVRGAITELFSPRGLGKTQVAYAIGVRLSRTGLRVLLVDRDNPRHEIRRRLRKWGGHDAERFKVITRDRAPALTDAVAWSAFPLDTFDLVIVDSIDASTEGVGEGDSAKPSVAFAVVLDLARRADGPAMMVLGNVVKSGAHSRGSGVLEDRGDIVYEIRDATDLKPSGQKDWWHELPPAGVGDWAQRASRRKRRELYRLAFIPTKFRLGEEPEPFVLEVDHRPEPWTLRDVTADLVAAGQAALTTRIRERETALAQATEDLIAQMRHRSENGKPPMTKGEAEALLQAKGLKRAAARDLVTAGAGRLWRLETTPNPGGKGTVVSLTFVSGTPCEASLAAKKDGEETPRQTTFSNTSFAADRMNSGRQRSESRKLAIHAGSSEGLSSPPSPNIHPGDGHGGEP